MLLTPIASRCRLLAQTLASGLMRQKGAIVAIRTNSTQATPAPTTTTTTTTPPPTEPEHIRSIVDQIAKLKFFEVTILNEALKRELKIPEVQRVAAGSVAAPGASAEGQDDGADVASVKSSFTVKLVKFEESKKVALIKEIKKLVEGINLVEAKRYVEDCPRVIKANITKEEAEELQKQLETAGGVVKLE